MKAAIYCRLSKEDEDHDKESESIQNQKSMLVKFALEKGYDIYNIYCDEDYSGMDRSRPDFCRMIEDARQHKFDTILAKTQSRFTRDMELVEKYLHGKFVEWGIRFIAVVDHVDTNDVANKKSRQINGLINEWYLEDLSVNIRSVLHHKICEGKYIATSPLFGYQKDPADKNHLIVDQDAAEVVKRVFSLYLSGYGCTKIASILNDEGIPNPTIYKQMHGTNYRIPERCQNSDLWSRATVYRMLGNRTYAGDLVQGRHKKVSYKSDRTISLPKSDWVVVPGTHEAIIDAELFDRVQEMLALRAKGGGDGMIHPLAGKVHCSICNSIMEQTGGGARKSTPTHKRYLRCRMQLRDKSRCSGQDYFPTDDLEEIVLGRIQTYLKNWFDQSKVQGAAFENNFEQKKKKKQQELHRLKTEIQRRDKAIRDLYLDKSSGFLDADQFLQMSQAFREESESLKARCAALEKELSEIGDASDQRKKMEQKLNSITSVQTLTRELVLLLIDTIIIYPPDPAQKSRRVDINWNF